MPYNPGKSELSAEKKSAVLVLILFVNLILISSQIVLKNKQSLLQTVIANMITPLQLTIPEISRLCFLRVEPLCFFKRCFSQISIRLKKTTLDLKIENYL